MNGRDPSPNAQPSSDSTQGDAADDRGATDSAASSSSRRNQPDFIVGVGASAGGLDALERFFNKMPPDRGLAFVVIQHLSPYVPHHFS